jgi:single-stranded DNA-binding protein
MIDGMVFLSNVRVAGAPCFFPSADPKKHRCLVTVIKNRGKNAAGAEMTDEHSLVFWGKYAQTCALYIDKGRAINVLGVERSHSKDTGRLKPSGAKEINRSTSIHVKSFEFGADSKKALVKRITANLEKAKQEGRLNPDATITAEELITVMRPAAYDYNPQAAQQTGRYGNARVWVKGIGFLGAGAVAVADPQAAQIDQMQKEIDAMKAEKGELVADAAVDAAVDAFPG